MNTMKIEGISLSEFNDKTGFQLIMTFPEKSILTQEQFNLCSDLILPREQLCEKMIAIQYKRDHFLLGMPSLSRNKPQDKIYHREKYIYSVSILIKKEDYIGLVAKQNLYKQIIRKLAYYFKFLEETCHYIYNHKSYSQYLRNLLKKILNDINNQKQCFLNHLCNHFTFININYSPIRQKLDSNLNNDIKDCEVPITNLSFEQIQNVIQSERGKKLLKYAYQGEYTIKKICDLNKDWKQTQIKHFYKKAIAKGLVFMVDLFSLNNTYILTDKINEFIIDSGKNTILKQIRNSIIIDQKATDQEFIDQQQIIFLYCEFNRMMPLSTIVAQHKSLFQKINLVKFVRLGVILGILRRIHYHVLYFEACLFFSSEQLNKYFRNKLGMKIESIKDKNFVEQQQRRMNDLFANYLVNNDSLDQICCSLEINYETLLQMISPIEQYIFAYP